VAACALLALAPPAPAALLPGEVFVADPEAGPGAKGAIVRVDATTGAQQVVSSGGQFEDPVGVAVGRNWDLFVVDSNAVGGQGAVFRVDPDTGAQQVVSSGGLFAEPSGIAAGFGVVVVDVGPTPLGTSATDGKLIYVNSGTGAQTAGPVFPVAGLFNPSGVTLASSGFPVFTDADGGDGGSGAVFTMGFVTRGAPATFRIASGGDLVDPFGVARVPSGFAPESAVVADPSAAGGAGAVIGVSPGQRVWSSGGALSDPTGVAFLAGPPSRLLVVDRSAGGSGGVFSVDPQSGAQAPISSGGAFVEPTGIATAPPKCRGEPASNIGSEGADSLGNGGTVVALAGDDRIEGDDTDDLVCAGEGDDRVESEIGIALEFGDDTYLGEAGNDKLIGGDHFAGADDLRGGPGRDRIKGNGARDRVSGGDGKDQLSGGNGRDRLTGDDGEDELNGDRGKDVVMGGKGADLLKGGKGNDLLVGGKGRDRCLGGGTDRTRSCER
jgi:Ca2+-binding RTX toxin-like protein